MRIEWGDIRFSGSREVFQKFQSFKVSKFQSFKVSKFYTRYILVLCVLGFGFATCGKVTQDPGCSDWNGYGNQSSVVGSNLAPPAGMRLMV